MVNAGGNFINQKSPFRIWKELGPRVHSLSGQSLRNLDTKAVPLETWFSFPFKISTSEEKGRDIHT